MSSNNSTDPPSPERDTAEHDLLTKLADDFAARYRRGESPSIDEYIEKHPALGDDIREVFPALLAMERFGLASNPSPVVERVGAMVGRYKLLERIGEGGFGVVFMAEQLTPVRRKVALKVIKPGMDTRQVIARFEAERQALAMMDHANIAKVLDAGATDSGRPYFVMELVPGIPITEYCDRERLAPRERLQLFVQVCQAVQHAHTKGIIHRDLKPTNVLVAVHDGVPVPKVIDFGVAKATGGADYRLTDKTLFTQFVQMVGTPLYMSPEQAQMGGLDVDTRSDIYSLGVLLYELLTGSTPFDSKRLGKAAIDELRRIIREEEPPKPSTRLSTSATLPAIAANRGLEPKQLSGLVRGELDWIVMRALEKDRNRRYATANGLASDVQRYLNDEAVQACPPSSGYRFRKFARRNKAALLAATAGVAALLLLVAGLAISNVLVKAERNEKAEALKGKEQALATAEAQRRRAEGNFRKASIAMREVLTKAALGHGEWSVLPMPLRQRFSEEAINFYKGFVQEGSSDPGLRYETAVGYRAIAVLHERSAQRDQAEQMYRQSVAILDKLSTEYPIAPQYRQQLAWTQYNLGMTLQRAGRLPDAQAYMRRSAQLYEVLLVGAPDSVDYRNELVTCNLALGALEERGGERDRAAGCYRRLVVLLEGLSSQHPETIQYHDQLAATFLSFGRLLAGSGNAQEAGDALRKAGEAYEKLLSHTSPHTLKGAELVERYKSLIILYCETNRLSNAQRSYERALEAVAKLPADARAAPDVRIGVGFLQRNWAFALWKAGRLAETEQVVQEAISTFEKLRTDHPGMPRHWHFLADNHVIIGRLKMQQNQPDQAEAAFREAVGIHRRRVAELPGAPYNAPEAAAGFLELAALLADKERLGEAADIYLEGIRMNPADAGAHHRLGEVYARSGSWDRATAAMAKAATQPSPQATQGHRGDHE